MRALPPPHPRRGCPWAGCHAGRSPGDLRQCPGRNILPAMSGVGEWGLDHLIIPAYHRFLRRLSPPHPRRGCPLTRVHAGRSPGDLRQCPGRNILPAMSGVGEWGLYHLIIPAYHPFLRGLPPPHPRTGCPRAGLHAGVFLPLSGYDYPAFGYGGGRAGVQPTTDRVVSCIPAGAAAPTPPQGMSMGRVSCWHVPATFRV